MFQIGDKIFYPMHGAGVIEAIEEREILGSKNIYYVMHIRNMQIMFPIESDIGIRQVVDSAVMENVLSVFNDMESESNLNPNQRYRKNMNKMKSGDIYEGAEVIRELIERGKKRALPVGDKNMLDNARQIFISELVLVRGITEEKAVDLLNEAINN